MAVTTRRTVIRLVFMMEKDGTIPAFGEGEHDE